MGTVDILAIRPHPDDECTGTGAILAHYAQRGVPVGVLTCTLGEEGEILDPELDQEEARPRLGEIRERELRAACEVLGVRELRLLGCRDSGMQGTPTTERPDAFCNVPLDDAGGRVAAIIRELRPRIVLTENERGTYGHPDHVMCHKAAVRGVELAAETGWRVERLYAIELVVDAGRQRIANMLRAENLDPGWFEGEDLPPEMLALKPDQADAAIDVGDGVETMRRALAKHRTQIPAGFFLLTWPEHIAREAFRTAYFRQLSPPPSGGPQLHDLLQAPAS